MPIRAPSPNAQLSAFLSRFSPGSIALAKRCLTKLRRIFPGAILLVYNYNRSVVVAFGVSETGSAATVALAVYPDSVRLYFGDGKSLPDPRGRLEGSASRVRYVTVSAARDLDHRDIRALFKAALKHSGVTFPRTGRSRMVIKSASKTKKKRPQ